MEPKINKANFVAFKKGLITNDYNFGTSLGAGSFGSVRSAVHKGTGQPRAVKILKKTEQEQEKLFLEVDILAKLSHPNIMQVYEFYDDTSNFYIVSELCSGGELFDCITDQGIFNERDAAAIMRQILSAICYSHENYIVHRDLKPENILLDDKSEDRVLKIIDWGGARYFQKNKKMTTISGTPYYIAPEVLCEVYDEKCDVWSCGVILYILLSGYPPFNGESDNDIMKAVKKGTYDFPNEEWDAVSFDCKSLIRGMLRYDPKNRLSAKDCLQHAWFKKNDHGHEKISTNMISNMKKFKVGRKLEQAATNFIVTQLVSKDERNKLLKQFKAWDSNGDGVLSRDEIYQGYKSLYGEVKANEEVVISSLNNLGCYYENCRSRWKWID
jgi:calcium-dependent protein kinase